MSSAVDNAEAYAEVYVEANILATRLGRPATGQGSNTCEHLQGRSYFIPSL